MVMNISDEKFEIPVELPDTMFQNCYDEDDGECLPTEKVKEGIIRELRLMEDLEVGEPKWRADLPPGTKVWSARWCHRKKEDAVRSRYVVRQFANTADVEMFAATPGGEAVRVLLAICSYLDMEAIPADFSVAFMHTPMTGENTYIEAPVEDGRGDVWLLKKALNGLREAAKKFTEYLLEILTLKLGFIKAAAQPTLLWNPNADLRMTVHVDDPLTVGHREQILNFYKELGQWLKVRVGAAMNATQPICYLGLVYLKIGQTIIEGPKDGYIQGMVNLLTKENVKAVVTPGVKRRDLTPADEEAVGPADHSLVRQIVGKCQFISRTRPDVLYALKEVGRQLHAPRAVDLVAAKRIVRYLSGTPMKSLHMKVGKNVGKLRGITDTDWAGCIATRKSTSCGMVFWGDFLISAYSRTQSVIALSSPEAEYIGCCAVAAEMLYIKSLLADMGFDLDLEISTDATGARAIASRQGVGRIRHMEVKYLWLQDQIQQKVFKIRKVAGKLNVSDVGTKHVDKATLDRCCAMLNLKDMEKSEIHHVESYQGVNLGAALSMAPWLMQPGAPQRLALLTTLFSGAQAVETVLPINHNPISFQLVMWSFSIGVIMNALVILGCALMWCRVQNTHPQQSRDVPLVDQSEQRGPTSSRTPSPPRSTPTRSTTATELLDTKYVKTPGGEKLHIAGTCSTIAHVPCDKLQTYEICKVCRQELEKHLSKEKRT